MEQEIWLPIKGYEGYYEVSNLGKVKSLAKEWVTSERWGVRKKQETILITKISRGYERVVLCVNKAKKTYCVHRLVAEHFCNKKIGCNVVNHINSIRNDNRAINLEWTTTQGNVIHSFNFGNRVSMKGERHGNSKLKEKDILEIRRLGELMTHKQISEIYSVQRTVITRIINKTRWGHIK
jgi:hypothetical protein